MANLETPQDASQASDSSSHPATESIYHSLSTYPFDTDQEYQAGLAAILGHPETVPTQEELAEQSALTVQAQCFYFSRKFNTTAIDPVAYSSWLESQGQPHHDHPTTTPSFLPTSTESTTSPSASEPASTSTSAPEPPYPNSFAAIVDLITRNIPVPGIEEIPTTILEPGSSKVDKTPRRKKPWEKDGDTDPTSAETDAQATEPSQPGDPNADDDTVDVNGHKETGQGVVNILKPNAIPDSGLLSKD